jgi:hypothetical protein
MKAKQEMYKTAQIAKPLDGFDVGQFVAVHYHATRFNAFTKQDEPIFIVRDNHGQRRYLFDSALSSFCL